MMIAQQLYEGIELPGEDAAIGLITYMRTDSVRVADQALDEVREHISAQYGDAVHARAAEPLQGEVERAGRARGDSSDVDEVHAGVGTRASHARSVLSLSPDLEPLRRVADDAGARSTTRRSDITGEQRLSVPREGLGAEVRGLARGLRPGHERGRGERADREADARAGRGRGVPTTRRRAACCRRSRKGRRSTRARSGRSRSSRSRRRATTKGRSSRRSRRTASAGRAPTRRSSRCCRRAST